MRLMRREALIARLRERLLEEGAPRLTMSLLVLLSGGAAFLFSALSLRAGIESMGLRYLLAGLVAYGAFLLCIRLWIAYRRRQLSLDTDFPDWIHETSYDVGAETGRAVFGGGRSGGAGAGARWSGPVEGRASEDLLEDGAVNAVADAIPVDSDEIAWVAVALVMALSGLIAVFYVVYVAPVLLAEVALDAALFSAIYARLRRRDAGHWAGSVLRRTWIPAVALIAFVAVGGYALERAVPGARSIGDVVEYLR